jgi:hypothetical protein
MQTALGMKDRQREGRWRREKGIKEINKQNYN